MIGFISDSHNHPFSAFATIDEHGINSRLQATLDEIWRAALAVRGAGGKTMFHGGDLFHVRGSVSPMVLNMTQDLFKRIKEELGITVVFNTGNHDLESKESSRLSNAVTAMETIGHVVQHEPGMVVIAPKHLMLVVPWHNSIRDLKEVLENWHNTCKGDESNTIDVLLHAPVDGVISGLPDHGLTPDYFDKFPKFRRVFSGHYHHHVTIGKFTSIGATTHQSFSDVDSRAGYILYDYGADLVSHIGTSAPRFVDITSSLLADKDELESAVNGNFVRLKLKTSDSKKIEAAREHFKFMGAAGVIVLQEKITSTTPRGAAVAVAARMEDTVKSFIDTGEFDKPAEVFGLCHKFIEEAKNAATR